MKRPLLVCAIAALGYSASGSSSDADPIPNAKLVGSDGSPTALGQVYVSLPGACQ